MFSTSHVSKMWSTISSQKYLLPHSKSATRLFPQHNPLPNLATSALVFQTVGYVFRSCTVHLMDIKSWPLNFSETKIVVTIIRVLCVKYHSTSTHKPSPLSFSSRFCSVWIHSSTCVIDQIQRYSSSLPHCFSLNCKCSLGWWYFDSTTFISSCHVVAKKQNHFDSLLILWCWGLIASFRCNITNSWICDKHILLLI